MQTFVRRLSGGTHTCTQNKVWSPNRWDDFSVEVNFGKQISECCHSYHPVCHTPYTTHTLAHSLAHTLTHTLAAHTHPPPAHPHIPCTRSRPRCVHCYSGRKTVVSRQTKSLWITLPTRLQACTLPLLCLIKMYATILPVYTILVYYRCKLYYRRKLFYKSTVHFVLRFLRRLGGARRV